jgi:hypothetical protein
MTQHFDAAMKTVRQTFGKSLADDAAARTGAEQKYNDLLKRHENLQRQVTEGRAHMFNATCQTDALQVTHTAAQRIPPYTTSAAQTPTTKASTCQVQTDAVEAPNVQHDEFQDCQSWYVDDYWQWGEDECHNTETPNDPHYKVQALCPRNGDSSGSGVAAQGNTTLVELPETSNDANADRNQVQQSESNVPALCPRSANSSNAKVAARGRTMTRGGGPPDDDDDDDSNDDDDDDNYENPMLAIMSKVRDMIEKATAKSGKRRDTSRRPRNESTATRGATTRKSSRDARHNNGDSDSEQEQTRRNRNDRRVPTDIVAPQFPKIQQFERYKTAIVEKVVTASNRDDHRFVTRWIKEVFSKDVDYNSLNKPWRGMNMIDKKLAVALSDTLPSELAR